MIAPVHVFAFADSAHPSLCTLASSVAFAGGRLNVVGLNSAESSGEVPPEALEVIAEALAEQGQEKAVEGQRVSTTLHCTSKEECLKSRGLAKVRKFLAVWPHLKAFSDDDLLLIMDGYDVSFEAPSLEHLALAFQRLQREIGPVMSLPTGPVIFSGEANCWPFPHPWGPEPFVSGDYRPNFMYQYEQREMRGKEVCTFWRHHMVHPSRVIGRDGHNRTQVLPVFLPFLNSGVFMGRARSLQQLFAFTTEVLLRFGDFDDQALITVAALHAKFLRRPWVPLQVDHSGELFASLHGLSPERLSNDLKAPPACDFNGRVDHGFFKAGSRPRRQSRWSFENFEAPFRPNRPPPLIWHFNGDKKEYFETKCHESVAMEASLMGHLGHCVLMDVDHERELYFLVQGPQETDVQSRKVAWHRLCRRTPAPPHLTQLAAIMAESRSTVWQVIHNLLVQLCRSPVMVSYISVSDPFTKMHERTCGYHPLHWLDLDSTSATRMAWQDTLRLRSESQEAEVPDQHTDPACILVDSTAKCQFEPDWEAYCSLWAAVNATWSCLPPLGPTA
ncbi:unnamed protein product [Durusdinium trenchii]|uniref:Uncharacterized protein n=1 Tax=Durusdinium trenchii TaxID=1381693 RepID=A0ABP0P0S1_9DINO